MPTIDNPYATQEEVYAWGMGRAMDWLHEPDQIAWDYRTCTGWGVEAGIACPEALQPTWNGRDVHQALWVARQKVVTRIVNLRHDREMINLLRRAPLALKDLMATGPKGADPWLGGLDPVDLPWRMGWLIDGTWIPILREAAEVLKGLKFIPSLPEGELGTARMETMTHAQVDQLRGKKLQAWVTLYRAAYAQSCADLTKAIELGVVKDAVHEALV